MGDSAGGLAAGVAILNRDRKGPSIARQLLVYPMIDDRTATPDPYIAPFAGWSYDDNITAWNALLGPGHEYDAIAFDADVSLRARSDRARVLLSL